MTQGCSRKFALAIPRSPRGHQPHLEEAQPSALSLPGPVSCFSGLGGRISRPLLQQFWKQAFLLSLSSGLTFHTALAPFLKVLQINQYTHFPTETLQQVSAVSPPVLRPHSSQVPAGRPQHLRVPPLTLTRIPLVHGTSPLLSGTLAGSRQTPAAQGPRPSTSQES